MCVRCDDLLARCGPVVYAQGVPVDLPGREMAGMPVRRTGKPGEVVQCDWLGVPILDRDGCVITEEGWSRLFVRYYPGSFGADDEFVDFVEAGEALLVRPPVDED